MILGRSKALVAFDAGSVVAGVFSPGFRGPRITQAARAFLPAGALVPSSVDPNVVDPEAVRLALSSVRTALGDSPRSAVLVLPEGSARTLLIAGASSREVKDLSRFRMSHALPYPVGEAVLDTLSLGGRRYLCGAVRRAIVEGYENAAERAGFQGVERVEIAPFVALAGLLRMAGEKEDRDGVAVLLGDSALSLAAFRGRALLAFRTRLRDTSAEEGAWLLDEILRTAACAGLPGEPAVAVLGSSAAAVARTLEAAGMRSRLVLPELGSGESTEAAQLAWLGAAIA